MFSCIVNSFSFGFSFGWLFDWSNASDSTTKKTSSVCGFFKMSSNESAELFNQHNDNTFGSVYLTSSNNTDNKEASELLDNPLNFPENRGVLEVRPSPIFEENKKTQYKFLSRFINWL